MKNADEMTPEELCELADAKEQAGYKKRLGGSSRRNA